MQSMYFRTCLYKLTKNVFALITKEKSYCVLSLTKYEQSIKDLWHVQSKAEMLNMSKEVVFHKHTDKIPGASAYIT